MPLSFICFRCRAHLKVRDETFLGSTLDCPDCGTPLLIAKSADGEIISQEVPGATPPPAGKPASHKPAASRKKPKSPAHQPEEPTPFEAFPAGASESRTPQIVAWIVAGVCLLALIPFLLPTSKPHNPVAEIPQKVPEKPVEPPAVVEAVVPSVEKVAPAPLPETPGGRLEELGKLVLKQAKSDGHFPAGAVPAAGLVPSLRWSWLAQLAARHDNPNALHIDWNERWNAPSQDRFVRRSIARFQNPLVLNKVSEDKYPAAHFVGVAGVGADAPTLPADHPRAGIFGQDRQTKLDQIRDGVSNTMLLAGVEEHLGSWAAGTTSYRSFTHEPYIHGPDGFGTGQPNSMLVLMADGSVREITNKTDPRIVRRMAAMNDGFSLDPLVEGEPEDPKPGTVPVPDPRMAAVKPAEKPLPPQPGAAVPVVAIPEPEKVLDIPAMLSRKVLKFDQSKPAAAFQLILQIEELAGVRIEYDRQKLGAVASRLDKQITLKKQGASLAELLDDILQQIELQRQTEKTCIRIVAPENT
ncbi:MAG: hypothetical protein JWN70_403 [Planctomycetaceae bacterium]|nr:hypothetical protein [Planctomycetaceae bacterium]